MNNQENKQMVGYSINNGYEVNVRSTPRDQMSEVVSHCLCHRQLWVSNLS